MPERFDVRSPGEIGLVYQVDQLPFDLPPNAWTFAYNVRFSKAGAEAARGWVKRLQLAEQCSQIAYNTGISGNYWVAFGQTKIYTIQDAYLVTDVSRAGAAYTSGDWHVHTFQGVPIATNNTEVPQAQFETGEAPSALSNFEDLPFWPSNLRCELLVGYKNFIVALNVTEDGDNFPTKIIWSDAAAPGDLPPSWDVDDPTTLAGSLVLPADTGPIVAAEVLRDDLIIYTVNAVSRLTFVGGAYVMKRREITRNFGAFGKQSVIAVKGFHYVLTRDDLVRFDGNQEHSVVQDRARRILQLATTASERGSARIAYNSAFDEIWFAVVFPTTAGQFTTFNALNRDGAIAQRQAPYLVDFTELPDRESVDRIAIASYTLNQIAQIPDLDGLNKVGDARLNDLTLTGSPDDYYVMGLGQDGSLYRMDYGYDFSPYSQYEAHLEKTDLDITGDENSAVVLAAYPRFSTEQLQETPSLRTIQDFADQGANDVIVGGTWSEYQLDQFYDGREPVRMYIGSQEAAGAPVNWREGKALQDHRKVTTKARGNRHAIKFVSQGHAWRLSGYMLEYERSGRR